MNNITRTKTINRQAQHDRATQAWGRCLSPAFGLGERVRAERDAKPATAAELAAVRASKQAAHRARQLKPWEQTGRNYRPLDFNPTVYRRPGARECARRVRQMERVGV